MLRKSLTQALAWSDKTMSVMQQRKLEECEARIRMLPKFGLWQGCTDALAESLWQVSLDADERPRAEQIHTAESLQQQVLEQLDAELALLSVAEYEMVHQLLDNGGTLFIEDWFEFTPAECLVRRLWCTLTIDPEDRMLLKMPPELCSAVRKVLDKTEHGVIRSQMLQYFITMICALNIYGMIYAEDALTWLDGHAALSDLPHAPRMINRMLHQTYDYIYTPKGDMVLLHPGIAEPERWMGSLTHVDLTPLQIVDPEADVPQMLLSEGERNAALQISGLIAGSLRPELNLSMSVEDLRVLVKQGVGLDTLSEVLSSMLTVRPSADMIEGLRMLCGRTPGFIFVSARQVH